MNEYISLGALWKSADYRLPFSVVNIMSSDHYKMFNKVITFTHEGITTSGRAVLYMNEESRNLFQGKPYWSLDTVGWRIHEEQLEPKPIECKLLKVVGK